MSKMHKRKSSKEEDDTVVPTVRAGASASNGHLSRPNGAESGHARSRTISTPAGLTLSVTPPSATTNSYPAPLSPLSPGGSQRSSTLPYSRPNGVQGHHAPSSPMRMSFSMPSHLASQSHSRTRSVSNYAYSPPSPSPLSASFPPIANPSASGSMPEINRHQRTGSRSNFTIPPAAPSNPMQDRATPPPPLPPPTSANARRHARLHSRNLSVFFPRPGAQSQPTIDEDGGQEIEYKETPEMVMPTASPRGKLGEGFTFGGRPPSASMSTNEDESGSEPPGSAGPRKAKRGHHHKHSMSHQFFSFLEPGANGRPQTNLAPSESDRTLLSASSAPITPVSAVTPAGTVTGRSSPFSFHKDVGRIPLDALLAFTVQFVLGAWLWVSGQAVGSLACTGLGYWVVFDAIGVGVGKILPAYLQRPGLQSPLGRPYGNARVETVALFSQGVYLMFSAVYVFKETVEHLLLSAGEGHHHHPGDEDVEISGIDFPLMLLFFTFISLLVNALSFDNHYQLVNITGNRLPPISKLLDPSRFKYSSYRPEPTNALGRLAENPYSLIAIALAAFIPLVSILIPATEHRAIDLLLAAAEAVAMFTLAYPACTSTGTVLLQTSPRRGLTHGRTEGFLRAMREIERHPDVQHLPPPHIWQLVPVEATPSPGASGVQPLVVALELRVDRKLDDPSVLRLTRWAHARCSQALGLGTREAAEFVTVGIVRG